MSGIRILIAALFLFAGLEGELHASASQMLPARSHMSPSDIITNLNSKTSFDSMTHSAPDRIPGILAERVMEPTPLCSFGVLLSSPYQSFARIQDDSFCVSGCSPPV